MREHYIDSLDACYDCAKKDNCAAKLLLFETIASTGISQLIIQECGDYE